MTVWFAGCVVQAVQLFANDEAEPAAVANGGGDLRAGVLRAEQAEGLAESLAAKSAALEDQLSRVTAELSQRVAAEVSAAEAAAEVRLTQARCAFEVDLRDVEKARQQAEDRLAAAEAVTADAVAANAAAQAEQLRLRAEGQAVKESYANELHGISQDKERRLGAAAVSP